MFERKGIKIKKQLTSYEKWEKSLHEHYSNPDWLSNCVSYCVNGTWYIRDKSQNNKIVKTFRSNEEYEQWYYGILYDE